MTQVQEPSYPQRIRTRVKQILSAHPVLFIPAFYYLGPRSKRDYLTTKESEIVIDGPPRSANTFAFAAFKHAQQRDIRIAHHLHVPAQIIRGVQLGIPTIALIREPVAAVRSLKLIFPFIDENASIRNWMRFFCRLESLMDRIVLADFNDVTKDYGQVIDAVNERFNTSFKRFHHTDENISKVYREIEELDQRESGGSDVYVARPSDFKRRAQEEIAYAFDQALVNEAEALYTRLTGRPIS